jgi:hypothetical protein
MKLCIWIYKTNTCIIITHYNPPFKYSVMLYIIDIMAMKWLQILYFYMSIMYVTVCQWMQSNQFLKLNY